MSLYEQVGGEKLRAVLEDFYERVFADAMIGFLFHGKDRALLVQREWEFTARLLGAKVPYSGRPMPQAHAHSPILGGHFARRLKLLRDVLVAHGVPEEVQRAWVGHNEALRGQVVRDVPGECEARTTPGPSRAGPG